MAVVSEKLCAYPGTQIKGEDVRVLTEGQIRLMTVGLGSFLHKALTW